MSFYNTRSVLSVCSMRALSLCILIFVIFANVILLFLIPRSRAATSNPMDPALMWDHFAHLPPTSCGSTPSEAKALGCQFDIMTYAWQPSPCYDALLIEDFRDMLSRKKLGFYEEKNNYSSPLDLTQIAKGEHEFVWMNWEHHRQHCAYMFRKLHRAMDAGRPVDGYIADYKHTDHCLKILMMRDIDPYLLETETGIKYPKCKA